MAILTTEKLYVANLGDAKAKLFRNFGNNNINNVTVVKLSNTHNSAKPSEMARLKKEFPDDKDIVVCVRPNSKACYVKGRLQPTRVK